MYTCSLNTVVYIFRNNQGQLIIEQIINNLKYWEKCLQELSWNEIYEFVELSSNIVETFRNKNFICFQKWICSNLVNNNLNFYHKCRLLQFLPKLVSNTIYDEPFDKNIR